MKEEKQLGAFGVYKLKTVFIVPLTTPRFEAVWSCKHEVVRRRSAVCVSAAELQDAVSDRRLCQERVKMGFVTNYFVRASFQFFIAIHAKTIHTRSSVIPLKSQVCGPSHDAHLNTTHTCQTPGNISGYTQYIEWLLHANMLKISRLTGHGEIICMYSKDVAKSLY